MSLLLASIRSNALVTNGGLSVPVLLKIELDSQELMIDLEDAVERLRELQFPVWLKEVKSVSNSNLDTGRTYLTLPLSLCLSGPCRLEA